MTATLANIKNRYELLAICNVCAHTVQLDTDALIAALGPDHPVPAIKKRLKCTRCGSDSCAVLKLWNFFHLLRWPIGSVKLAGLAAS